MNINFVASKISNTKCPVCGQKTEIEKFNETSITLKAENSHGIMKNCLDFQRMIVATYYDAVDDKISEKELTERLESFSYKK